MEKEKHASYSSHDFCKSLSEELRDYVIIMKEDIGHILDLTSRGEKKGKKASRG